MQWLHYNIGLSETLLDFLFDDGEGMVIDGKQFSIDKLDNIVRDVWVGWLKLFNLCFYGREVSFDEDSHDFYYNLSEIIIGS